MRSFDLCCFDRPPLSLPSPSWLVASGIPRPPTRHLPTLHPHARAVRGPALRDRLRRRRIAPLQLAARAWAGQLQESVEGARVLRQRDARHRRAAQDDQHADRVRDPAPRRCRRQRAVRHRAQRGRHHRLYLSTGAGPQDRTPQYATNGNFVVENPPAAAADGFVLAHEGTAAPIYVSATDYAGVAPRRARPAGRRRARDRHRAGARARPTCRVPARSSSSARSARAR